MYRPTEMIADLPAKIKIMIFQHISERQVANERRSSNYGQVMAQFAIFALLNSEVTGPVFTKILHDVEPHYSAAIDPCINKTILHFV